MTVEWPAPKMVPKRDPLEIRTKNLGQQRSLQGKKNKWDFSAFPAKTQQFLEWGGRETGQQSSLGTQSSQGRLCCLESTDLKLSANWNNVFPSPAELSLSLGGPLGNEGARSCLEQVLAPLWRDLGGGGRAWAKVHWGHAPRGPGCSARPHACSPGSCVPSRLPTAACAPSSAVKRPWRSPGASCTSACAWLQRWPLSWQDSWWVSANPCPQLNAAAALQEKRGWAVLASSGLLSSASAWDAELLEFQQNWKPNRMQGLPKKV